MVKTVFQFIILLQSSLAFIFSIYTSWKLGYLKVNLAKGLEGLARLMFLCIFVSYFTLSLQLGLDLYYKFNPCISDYQGHALAFPMAMVGLYFLMLFYVCISIMLLRSCHHLIESIDNAPQEMVWFFKIFISYPYLILGLFGLLYVGIVVVIALVFWENPVAAWFWLKNTTVMTAVVLQISALIMARTISGLRPVIRRNAELLAAISPKLAQAGFDREVQLSKAAIIQIIVVGSVLLLQFYVIITGSLQWQSRLNYNYSEKSCYDGYDIDFIDFNSSVGGIVFCLMMLRSYNISIRKATDEVEVNNNDRENANVTPVKGTSIRIAANSD